MLVGSWRVSKVCLKGFTLLRMFKVLVGRSFSLSACLFRCYVCRFKTLWRFTGSFEV